MLGSKGYGRWTSDAANQRAIVARKERLSLRTRWAAARQPGQARNTGKCVTMAESSANEQTSRRHNCGKSKQGWHQGERDLSEDLIETLHGAELSHYKDRHHYYAMGDRTGRRSRTTSRTGNTGEQHIAHDKELEQGGAAGRDRAVET